MGSPGSGPRQRGPSCVRPSMASLRSFRASKLGMRAIKAAHLSMPAAKELDKLEPLKFKALDLVRYVI